MSQEIDASQKNSLFRSKVLSTVSRYLFIFIIAFILFGFILLLAGKDPLLAYKDVFSTTLSTSLGLSEVIIKMIPLLFTAVAAALPSRIGLINVGAEGQLFMGAWLATWGALTFNTLPIWILLPLMIILGMLGGALWAFLPALLRARGIVNETITSLLLNYVSPMIVSFFIYGPWRSVLNTLQPQTDDFVQAARLPTLFGTQIHFGLIIGIVVLVLYWLVMKYTRWGLEMRAIGNNPQSARRNGIPLVKYIIIVMCLGGAIAGLAGMSEVSGLFGRLRPDFSTGFGFTGFLISWLTGGNPIGIVIMAFVMAVFTTGGDILQITQGIPYAVINILLAITLFVVLARPEFNRGKKI